VWSGTATPETDVKIEEEEDVKDVLEGDELDDEDTEVKKEDDEQDDDDHDDDEDYDDDEDDDNEDDDNEENDDEENDDEEDMHETTKRGTYTVIRFLWVGDKFGTYTIASVNGTLVEDKMRRFKGERAHFIFNKGPIYTHDGASAKFTTNSHETDYSVFAISILYLLKIINLEDFC
jgi:hypothetical protein